MSTVWICTGLFVGLLLLAAIGRLVLLGRYKRLAANRPGETFATFRAEFESTIPDDVLRAVYKYFQDRCAFAVSEFPVLWSDKLVQTYGIDSGEIEDMLNTILKACGRGFPPVDQV